MNILPIIIIVSVIISCIFCFMYKDSLINAYYSRKWFRINKKSNISDKQYRQLLLGGIFAEQQGAYLNSLETGINNKEDITENWWSIYNRDDAVKTLDKLYENSEKLLYNDEFLQSSNFKESCQQLIEKKVIRSTEEAKNIGISAWYSGRLVFMTRLCYDLNYVSEQEAWGYIQKAYDVSKPRFDSWESFGKSYILGRSVWAGNGMMNDDIIDIMHIIVNNDDSPWKKVKW